MTRPAAQARACHDLAFLKGSLAAAPIALQALQGRLTDKDCF